MQSEDAAYGLAVVTRRGGGGEPGTQLRAGRFDVWLSSIGIIPTQSSKNFSQGGWVISCHIEV